MEGDPEEEGCQSDGDLRRKPVPSYGGTAFVVFILALAGFAFCLKKRKERKKERRSNLVTAALTWGRQLNLTDYPNLQIWHFGNPKKLPILQLLRGARV